MEVTRLYAVNTSLTRLELFQYPNQRIESSLPDILSMRAFVESNRYFTERHEAVAFVQAEFGHLRAPFLTKMSTEVRQAVQGVADRLGCPIDWRRGKNRFIWNGTSIAGNGMSGYDLSHEIAHWVCATPKERELPEFGLGRAPGSTGDEDLDPAVSTRREIEAENHTLFVDVHLQRWLGWNWRVLYSNFGDETAEIVQGRKENPKLTRALDRLGIKKRWRDWASSK